MKTSKKNQLAGLLTDKKKNGEFNRGDRANVHETAEG